MRDKMQREVVKILKRYLDKGYDDHQTEIAYASPFDVLMDGGVSEMPISDFNQANPPPSDCVDRLVRPLARELIATIRGVQDVDLYIIPDKCRVIRMLMDIAPLIKEEEQRQWAEDHAQYVLEELTQIKPRVMWRGKIICEG